MSEGLKKFADPQKALLKLVAENADRCRQRVNHGLALCGPRLANRPATPAARRLPPRSRRLVISLGLCYHHSSCRPEETQGPMAQARLRRPIHIPSVRNRSMAFDSYSPCPGGTGKKIKFCCSEFVPELEKLQRMVEGEQRVAALELVGKLAGEISRPGLPVGDQVLPPGRSGESGTRRPPRLPGSHEKHPDNPVALADVAVSTAGKDAPAAVRLLQAGDRKGRRSIAAASLRRTVGRRGGAVGHRSHSPRPRVIGCCNSASRGAKTSTCCG